MKIQYDPVFLKLLKKTDIRVRKSFKERIVFFSKSPTDPVLNNHSLGKPYQGCRSIDITSDWRAVYEEVEIGQETIAYFIVIGTHKQLYGP